MPPPGLPAMHKSGALKKQSASHRLNPLRGPKSSYSNHEPLENDFNSYTPHKNSTQKRDYGDKMIANSSYTDHKAYSKYQTYKGKPGYGASVLSREYNSDYTKY